MTRCTVWVREGLLWTAAVLGGLSLVLAVLAATGAARPLIFTSGSMAPEIPAGSLAFSRPVGVTDLAVGDVVNVTRRDGQQVTHRIAGIELEGQQANLTLKGDANPVVDAETYAVGEANRVVVHVPALGRLAAMVENPMFCVVLVAIVGWLILSPTLLRHERPRGRRVSRGRRRRRFIGAPMVLVILALTASTLGGTATRTLAGFTDTATVASSAFSSGQAASPTPAATSCTGGTTATIRWNGVLPTGGSAPAHSNYEYVVSLVDRDTNNQIGQEAIPHSGGAGSVQSRQYTSSLLGNLFGLNLLGTQRIRVEVRSRVTGTSWTGPSVVSINFTATTVLATVYSCP